MIANQPIKSILEDVKTRFRTFIFIVRNTGLQGSMSRADYKACIKQIEENVRALVVTIGLKLTRWGMGKGWNDV